MKCPECGAETCVHALREMEAHAAAACLAEERLAACPSAEALVEEIERTACRYDDLGRPPGDEAALRAWRTAAADLRALVAKWREEQ